MRCGVLHWLGSRHWRLEGDEGGRIFGRDVHDASLTPASARKVLPHGARHVVVCVVVASKRPAGADARPPRTQVLRQACAEQDDASTLVSAKCNTIGRVPA